MRKLLFCISSPHVGGNTTVLMQLINALAKKGYCISLIAHTTKRSAFYFRPRTWIRSITLVRKRVPHLALLRACSKNPPDLIVAADGFSTFAVELALKLKRPLICRMICNLKWWVKERPLLIKTLKFTGRFSNRVIAVSKSVERSCKAFGLKNVKRIYEGCDIHTFRPSAHDHSLFRKEFKMKPGEIALGVVANILASKSHEVVVEALARLPKNFPLYRCFFVGEYRSRQMAAQKRKLRRLIEQFGLQDKVVFTGFLKDSKKIMNGLDIVLFPFQGEACPLSLVEAMACERAVIVNDAEPFHEFVSQGRDGVIVSKKNPDALAREICRLARSLKTRTRIGRRARLKILKHFSIEKQTDCYDRLFRKTLEN